MKPSWAVQAQWEVQIYKQDSWDYNWKSHNPRKEWWLKFVWNAWDVCVFIEQNVFSLSCITHIKALHTSVQLMCTHINFMQYKMIDSVRGETVSFSHPTLCFIATKCLQNTPPPHRFHRYSEERAWQGGEGTVSGCEKKTTAASVLLYVSVLHSHGRLGGTCAKLWCHPSFYFVPTPAWPTGSFAAVSQLLSRSLSPLHVCLCVFCTRSLLICYTHAPPIPFCSLWYELWMQYLVGCVPAREFLSDYSLPQKVEDPHPCFVLCPGQP